MMVEYFELRAAYVQQDHNDSCAGDKGDTVSLLPFFPVVLARLLQNGQ